jgi:hypothetical protein
MTDCLLVFIVGLDYFTPLNPAKARKDHGRDRVARRGGDRRQRARGQVPLALAVLRACRLASVRAVEGHRGEAGEDAAVLVGPVQPPLHLKELALLGAAAVGGCNTSRER